MSDNAILFWTMIGTGLTALGTAGLFFGAIAAYRKAKETLQQMQDDASAAATRFDQEIMQRQLHEEQKRQDEAKSALLEAASDVIAATNVSKEAVYEASMNLRKANLKFVLTYELQKGQGDIESFCACLSMLAKASMKPHSQLAKSARVKVNEGQELLFQSLLALHRGDIEMPEFLNGLGDFANEVKDKPSVLKGVLMHMEEQSK